MLKKDLIQRVEELEKKAWEDDKAFISANAYQKSRELVENKLEKEKQEAITALEVWKSGCLESQELNMILQNRMSALRQLMQLELIKNPIEEAETKEEYSNVIHSIIKALARKLIDMEDKVKPILYHYLPVPRIMGIIQEERTKRDKETMKNLLESQLPAGFFTSHVGSKAKNESQKTRIKRI